MRAIYLSNWWRGLRKQSWNTSVVEFVSGIEFILREMLAGIVRIIVPGRQNQS